MAASTKTRADALWLKDPRLAHKALRVLTPLYDPDFIPLGAPRLIHFALLKSLLAALLNYTMSSCLRAFALLCVPFAWSTLPVRSIGLMDPPGLC